MQLGKRAAVVLAAVAAWGTSTWAADPPAPTPAQKMPTPPTVVTATPRRPIMELLDQAGLATQLDEWHINIGGNVEGGWTYNFDTPDNKVNPGRVFDFEHNKPILDQAMLFGERVVDPSKQKFDLGGRVEARYGADSGLIHANGLSDYYDGPRDPKNQLDLTQLYIDAAIPVGNGLLLRVGKFVTLMGAEVINPEGNALYSHSFMFGFAIPFTQTGILGSYNLNDQWSITAGITRGWDQAFDDNNDDIDFLGEVKWAANKDTTAILNVSIGPQRANNNDDYRYLLDLVVTTNISDQLTIMGNADFAWEDNAGLSGQTAYWWGIAGYAGYKINDNFTLNGRVEWFHDDDGSRLGIETNLYELTVGLNVKPLPKDRWGQYLQIRPELRVDLSDDDVFDQFTKDTQFTFGIDVVYGL